MNDETKELMIHVERIVRPLEASGGRKLRMRRELLAHLESALEEERERAGTEAERVEQAKKRLGDSLLLRQQLQRSVPRLERWMLREFPAPALVKRWENRSAQDWAMLSTAQTLVLLICSAFLTLLALAVFNGDNRLTFFALQTSDPWRYGTVCVIAGLLAGAIPWQIISLMGKALQEGARSRAVVWRVVGFTALEFAWVLLVNSQLFGHPITSSEILRAILMGVGIAALQVGASRMVARMRNCAAEWKQLDIAEG